MSGTRLLSILMLLQARDRVTAAELAKEFDVSVRTIHRDIDCLGLAGVPVYAERGRCGGFRLIEGYRTQLTGLTHSEAHALFLAGLPGPAAQLGLSGPLSASRLKLMAALPADTRAIAERVALRFHIDPVPWFHSSAATLPCLEPVARAVWSDLFLRVGYRRSGEKKARPRKLGPLGLVLKGGIWYLVAKNKTSIRTYRVANIQDVQVTDEPFVDKPASFDLSDYWESTSQAYEVAVYKLEADVRLSPKGVALLELLGPYVMKAAERTATKPDKQGWVHCRLPFESIDFGVREFMRLGADVQIVGPLDLVERWALVLKHMRRIHALRNGKT